MHSNLTVKMHCFSLYRRLYVLIWQRLGFELNSVCELLFYFYFEHILIEDCKGLAFLFPSIFFHKSLRAAASSIFNSSFSLRSCLIS